MASGYRCLALRAFPTSASTRICTRSFSTRNNLAEEQTETTISPRARAQRESADAVQKLAQSRQHRSGGVHMRRVILTPPTGDISPDAPLPTFSRPRDDRRPPFSHGSNDSSSFRGSSSSSPRMAPRSARDSDPRRPQRPQRPRTASTEEDGGRASKKQVVSMDEYLPDLDSGGDAMTTEEHDAYLKQFGHVKEKADTTFPGPHLDMASMLLEYAPRNVGATEPVTGQYPSMVDERSRGLLQHIIAQVRKNETYTEADIEKLTKKLGPVMPRA